MEPGSDRSHRGNGDGSERCAAKDADVTATDTERGTVLSTKTNDAGAYNITRVPVGSYTVKISAPGFQTAVHTGIVLVLNQTARIDMQMKMDR
jgi:hypothetical protein